MSNVPLPGKIPFNPANFHTAKYLKRNPNLKGALADIATLFEVVYDDIINVVEVHDVNVDGAEYAAGIRKMIEAKDCFVRSVLDI